MDIDWAQNNILRIGNEVSYWDKVPKEKTTELRDKIEPWLTAVFQAISGSRNNIIFNRVQHSMAL